MLHWAASPERDPAGPVPANLSPRGIAREAFRRGIEQTVYTRPYHAGQNVVQACWTHTAFALSTARVAADLLPDVLDVDQGRDGADLGVLRAL